MKSKNFIYFLLFLLLQSCFLISHKYKITNNYIKSNLAFYQGFQFSELKVDSLDSLGIPIKFEKVRSVYLEIDNPNRKQSKKIYFYEPNSNYFWSNPQESRLPILPIIMKVNNWYFIEGLVFWGNPTLNKFIYMDERGNCHSYTVPHISNW